MKLIELKLKDARNGMQGLVILAGGCLHIADYEDGQFVIARTSRRGLTVRGVEKIWQAVEAA